MPGFKLSEPLPVRIRFVTPAPLFGPLVRPLNNPANGIVLSTVIVRLLILALPAGKTAAAVGSQMEGDAISVDVVDHCAVVVSQVPLVGGKRPFGSQKLSTARASPASRDARHPRMNSFVPGFFIMFVPSFPPF